MTVSKNTEWKPSPKEARDVQGIVVSAYPKMLSAVFLMMKFTRQRDGIELNPKGWLLDVVSRITDANGERPLCINLAFSAAGLEALGIGSTVVSTFSRPFREGITYRDRPRFLGDTGIQDPSTWRWSDSGSDPKGVHALLMLYAENGTARDNLETMETEKMRSFGLTPFNRIRTDVKFDSKRQRTEHFGFADGISQPILIDADKVPVEKRKLHEIAAGEVVLGETNTYGMPAEGPVVASSPAALANLEKAKIEGFFDLGRNGTYLVVRQLRQDVPAFWNNMKAAAVALVDDYNAPATSEWLAQKSVGRTQSGEILLPNGSTPDNESTFFAKDRMGFGCPVTSHVRRANPRDGLAPNAGDVASIVQATNRHRIMRRGRIYGEPITDNLVADGVDRGLVFACLNSEIDRQFEFVQHTWLLNPMFGGAFEESDPLIGPKCPFSIPSRPVRQQPTLETYITTTGGGYFFLPSISAIRYLGQQK